MLKKVSRSNFRCIIHYSSIYNTVKDPNMLVDMLWASLLQVCSLATRSVGAVTSTPPRRSPWATATLATSGLSEGED